jgi:cyclophilin family peptidyl-prolyl cis-trans isomerase
MSRKYPQVYLDVTIGTKPAGRIIFELFTDLTPKTAENFRGLCTGEYGNVGMGTRTKQLHYFNTMFHRIVEGFALQGGDITNGDGTGGASIYGPTFADENFNRNHACAGLLSMANRGRNTNSSQFFITLKACPHLDGKHVVFGQVISGMEAVRKIAKVPVDMNDKPKIPVVIVDCGEVGGNRDFLRYDPFQKSIADEQERIKDDMKAAQKKFIELQKGGGIVGEGEKKEEEKEDGNEKKVGLDEVDDEEVLAPIAAKLNGEKLSRLEAIKLKLNEARKQNNQAVLEEERKLNDPTYDKVQRAKKWHEKKKELLEENTFKGIDEDKDYLNTTAIRAESTLGKRGAGKKGETFGWDVFNEDSLFNAYKKRLKAMPHYKEVYDQQKQDPSGDFAPSEERLQRLVDDMQEQEKKREKFSRRRAFQEDEDIDYINDRNRVYNKKLERAFGKYAADIKLNLERGTALN